MSFKSFKDFINNSHIYTIAEIGINHNGSLEIAKKLIDIAVLCNCDAVKFQKRTIEIVYSEQELNKKRESPWGSTQKEQKEGLEFNISDYDEINKYCKIKGIDWFASSWDINSQKIMRKYNFPFNKIASAMSTNKDFIREVASEGIPTFASTGMTTLSEIDYLVSIFKEYNCDLMLMHTVSTYPSLDQELNLKTIQTFSNKYSVPIGYSGHEVSIYPSVIAAALGAKAVERHITLDRKMYGSDQSASLQKEELGQLTAILRKLPEIMGDGEKIILEKEHEIASKLRYWVKK